MKRTTIFVPEALERDLQLYARKMGKPTAAIVREALAAYIAGKRPSMDLPSFVGAFDSGRSDTAERHEEILFRNLERDSNTAAVPKRNAPRMKKSRTAVRRRS
jgi:hypothetical protein